jgi:16S rRNA processing protein RimM
MLPFSNAVVPTVDITGGRVIIALPEEIEGRDDGPTIDETAPNLSANLPSERGDP